MAGQKISQLSGLETLTGAEKIPVELNGGNYSIPTSLLKPFVFTWKPNRDQSFDQLIKCLTTGIPVIYKVSDQEVYPVIGYAKIGAQDTIALWSRNSADALNVVVAKDPATGGVSVVSMDYVDIVKYVNASDDEHPNRKAIQLRNNDPLTGIANKEGLGSVNIAMVNDKDIVDLGTSELPINLNTPAGVRPTVQEAGQTGETANKIAYLSDLDNAGGDVEVVKITRFFNESPSVLEYQTYILPEENTKLWNALESGKTIVLALYDGNNPADAYVTLTAVYGNLFIEEVAEDVINIEVSKTGYDNTYGFFVKYYKYGTFTKGDDGNQIIAYNDSPTNSMYFEKSGDGTKYLNDKGTYTAIPTSGGDVEVIKLSEWFNESPSVLIEQTWIFPEENAKLFNALENNKTIILALYNGSGFDSPYNSLKTVYGKLSINHISATKIEISVEDWSIYSNRNTIQMYSLKLGPFDKSETGTYIVNANSGGETTSMTFQKGGTGTQFLNDKGSYVIPNQLGDGTQPATIKTATDVDVSHVIGETSYKMWDARNLPDPAPLTDVKSTSLITITNNIPIWEDGISYRIIVPTDNIQVSDEAELKRRVENDIPFSVSMLYTTNGLTFKMHMDTKYADATGDLWFAYRCFLTQGGSCFDVQYLIKISSTTGLPLEAQQRVVKMADDYLKNLTPESPEIVNKLKNIIVYTENEGTEGQILKIVNGKPTWVDPS